MEPTRTITPASAGLVLDYFPGAHPSRLSTTWAIADDTPSPLPDHGMSAASPLERLPRPRRMRIADDCACK
jgi:hypothetical protein